jgi:hypothetical protein
MQTVLKVIVLQIVLIVAFCTPVENSDDTFSIIRATSIIKKYTVIDTTILDSSIVSISETPTNNLPLCWIDTLDNQQYLDSVCFPSDFLSMEFNKNQNTANYLKRTFNLQYRKDSIQFIGQNYSTASPCESVDTNNRSINSFLLYGNTKEILQNDFLAKSKNAQLLSLFNSTDVYKLIFDRKLELAKWNKSRDSIIENGGKVSIIGKPLSWSTGLRDTASYYYIKLCFSLLQ